ncbi:hypothetical protein D3C78_1365500 [compost metagenome]
MRLRAVFDHRHAMLLGQRHDGVHVARPARQVHADHSAGARCDDLGNGRRREVAAVGIDFGKNRRGACIHHAGNAGNEGARRDHHLVSRANAQGFQRHIQRQCAVTQGDRMRRAAPGRKFLFERAALGARPVIDLVGQNNVAYGIGFFRSKAGPGGDRGVQHCYGL